MTGNNNNLLTELLQTCHHIANKVDDATKLQRVTEMAIYILLDNGTVPACDGTGKVTYTHGDLNVQMHGYYGDRFTIQIATPIKSPKGDVSEDPIRISVYDHSGIDVVVFTITGARNSDFEVAMTAYGKKKCCWNKLMTKVANAILKSSH